jgi:APA family basic amino acid/polyamine antiporter
VAGLVAALWAYDGWTNAGSCWDPRSTGPQKTCRAPNHRTLCMVAIYLLANLAYFYILNSAR